jgi:hypothetical protein
MCDRDILSPGSRAHLVLEYGVDEQTCERGIAVDERGMRFISGWRFSLGTQLSVKCRYRHPRLGWSDVVVEGIVVWSEQIGRGDEQPAYETTVLFLDLPEDLRRSLREFSFHLETAG